MLLLQRTGVCSSFFSRLGNRRSRTSRTSVVCNHKSSKNNNSDNSNDSPPRHPSPPRPEPFEPTEFVTPRKRPSNRKKPREQRPAVPEPEKAAKTRKKVRRDVPPLNQVLHLPLSKILGLTSDASQEEERRATVFQSARPGAPEMRLTFAELIQLRRILVNMRRDEDREDLCSAKGLDYPRFVLFIKDVEMLEASWTAQSLKNAPLLQKPQRKVPMSSVFLWRWLSFILLIVDQIYREVNRQD